eukprot:6337738-Heterocapsa_arctica.AAC.1
MSRAPAIHFHGVTVDAEEGELFADPAHVERPVATGGQPALVAAGEAHDVLPDLQPAHTAELRLFG